MPALQEPPTQGIDTKALLTALTALKKGDFSVRLPLETASQCATAYIRASPNPVPAGEGQGQTTISWDTCDGSIGKVYVSINDGQELLFADGRRGSAPAHWIETGSNYEFRLYNSDHTELLTEVCVTRARNQPPCEVNS